MSRIKDRNYQQDMMNMLAIYGVPAEEVLEHVLDYWDGDHACEALEDYFSENDIELPQ